MRSGFEDEPDFASWAIEGTAKAQMMMPKIMANMIGRWASFERDRGIIDVGLGEMKLLKVQGDGMKRISLARDGGSAGRLRLMLPNIYTCIYIYTISLPARYSSCQHTPVESHRMSQ
jgi:hypothetical protein